MSNHGYSRLLAALPFAVAATLAVPAQADAVADFYKGKNVEIYVGAGAGGGYGLYTRVLAEFLSRHVPGQPTFTPKFMSGSAGVKMANYFYNVAPKNGSALGMPLSSIATSEATGRKGIKYKSDKINWLGRMVDIVTVATVKRDLGVKSVDDARGKEIVAGVTRPGSTTHMPFAIMNWALGTKFKIVSGYKGSAGPALAYDKGEVQAVAAPWVTLRARRPHLLNDVQLVQVALAKDPQGMNVPLMIDLVNDPAKKAAVRFLSAQASIGRSLTAPPGVPHERLDAIAKGFAATMRDPAFLATAKKRKMDLNFLAWKPLQEMVEEHLHTPADIVKVAKKAAGMK